MIHPDEVFPYYRILNWVKQADLDEGRRHDCLTTVESEQLFLDHASPFRYEMVHAYEA